MRAPMIAHPVHHVTPQIASRSNAKHFRILFVIAIVLIAFTVRVAYLEAPSFWVDEAYSREWSLMQPSAMIADLAFDHVPLYYLILHVWVKLTGLSVFSLRALSTLLGTLVVAQLYVLGKRLSHEKVGQTAALLAAVSPFLVFYSRMARPYPLLWFLTLWAINTYLWALKDRRWRSWILYAVVASTAAYTHFTALAVLGFLGLHALLHWKQLRPQLPQWILAHGLLVATFAPFLNKLFHLVASDSSVIVSRGALTPWYLADIFVSWNLGHAFGVTTKLSFGLTVISFGVLAVIGMTSAKLYDHITQWRSHAATTDSSIWSLFWEESTLLLGCLLSPLVLGVIAKLLSPDTLAFSPRSLSVGALPYYLLLARGIQRLKPSLVRRCVRVGCVLVMLVAVGLSVDKGGGINWRWVAEHIQRQEQPDDVILVIPSGNYLSALETYYTGTATLQQKEYNSLNMENVDDYLAPVLGFERLWLITINDAQFDPQNMIGEWLATRCTLQEQEMLIPKHAQMRLYGQCNWSMP
ncbi:MAG TPA: glycosyltransferase family 39 protein [Anaerolineae bacterium]|nr:glycosyltransferase family 39 protein [Anaerolineae bacterium]HQI83602.1 glycosyltransferase family 39 protein [Anaerolineae bacterium]